MLKICLSVYSSPYATLPLTIWRLKLQPHTRETIGVRTLVFLLSYLYDVTEKEAFAVFWAMQCFHPYVYGIKATVLMDHKALEWLKNIKDPDGTLAC